MYSIGLLLEDCFEGSREGGHHRDEDPVAVLEVIGWSRAMKVGEESTEEHPIEDQEEADDLDHRGQVLAVPDQDRREDPCHRSWDLRNHGGYLRIYEGDGDLCEDPIERGQDSKGEHHHPVLSYLRPTISQLPKNHSDAKEDEGVGGGRAVKEEGAIDGHVVTHLLHAYVIQHACC